MKKILKYILITLGSVTLLWIGLCILVYYNSPKGPSEFNEIRKLEKENMNSEIIKKLNSTSDIDGFLLNNFSTFSKQEDMLILSWLLNRETEGKLPYYYYASIFYAKQKEKVEFLNIIALAMLTSRIDSARCTDPSSFDVYLALESTIFYPAIKSFKNSSKLRKRLSKRWALAYEEAIKDRASVCSEVIPREEWEVKRSRIRKEFLSN